MSSMERLVYGLLAAMVLCAPAAAQGAIVFDFDSAPLHSPLPVDVTVNGITAHLSATGQGFSIQQADTMGFTPAGFSGYCIYPSSVFAADLLVAFSQKVASFSILYAPQELACDSSARMRVTAYLDGVLVGTNTTTADPPGTWPAATLSISSAKGFNSVVVHYDAPPPTGGDWGPIFMADNMSVTRPVPEPAGWVAWVAGLSGPVLLRRKRRQREPAPRPRPGPILEERPLRKTDQS
jgi:hypothetical protein